MDIVEWLRQLKMSTANADWNATIVNNRLDEAADEIELLRKERDGLREAFNDAVQLALELQNKLDRMEGTMNFSVIAALKETE